MLHLGGGSGSESYNRASANLVDYRANAAILGAKVVTPLRDAVSLIDGVERNLYRFEEFDVFFLGERLWSYVEQLRLAVENVLLHTVDGLLIERGVEKMGNSVVLTEVAHGIYLILHQCDERRNHNSRTLHD